MGRPREHDERTAVALLEAAERLVDDLGPAAVSVRAVAEAAGTSTRAVYALYGSKAGLVDALAGRLFELLAQRIDALPPTQDPVADVVTASVEGFRRVALDHPALYRLVFLSAGSDLPPGPGRPDQAAAAFARLEHLMSRVITTRQPSAREAARAVHALTEGLATIELRGELGRDRQARRVWQTAVGALVRGLAADSG